MAKIGTNGVFNLNFQVAPSGGRWVSLELILEVMEAMPGSVVPLAMFCICLCICLSVFVFVSVFVKMRQKGSTQLARWAPSDVFVLCLCICVFVFVDL